jgi:hypothetical protein
MCEKFVTAVEKSKNSKTGEVSVTYAPIQSCPSTCPFLDKGCYAQSGHSAFTLNRLNRNAEAQKKTRPIDIALEEAKQIHNLSGEKDLRLHIVGDAKTPKAAEILAWAAKDHISKAGKMVWTYTHAWKNIPRKKWGDISVLASCETIEECKKAMERGYAASVVRLKPFKGSFNWQGVKMTACPALSNHNVKCEDCGKCLKDQSLLENNEIVCFFPHGVRKNAAKQAIRNKDMH